MKSNDYNEIFVSPQGNDMDDGSFQRPFFSLHRAQKEVRRINAEMKMNIRINIMPGSYFLSEPLIFDERDNGKNNYVVEWKGVSKGKVKIFGGKPIKHWENVGEGIYRAPLEKASKNSTLIENSEFSKIARIPKEGYFLIKELSLSDSTSQFVYFDGDIKSKFNQKDAQVYIWPGEADWNWFSELRPIKFVEFEKNKIVLEEPCVWKLDHGTRYFLQGSRDFLQKPGEYVISSDENLIYYKPKKLPIEEQEIVLTSMPFIIKTEGSSRNSCVQNIKFNDLTFIGSDFPRTFSLPDENEERIDEIFGQIYIKNAENIEIYGCEFLNAGVCAITMKGHAINNKVIGCSIKGAGYNGIYLIGWAPGDGNFDSSEEAYENRGNLISNNHIYDCGKRVGHGSGIQLYQSGDNEISHNKIHHMPRYGISLKGNIYSIMRKDIYYYNTNLTYDNHWDFLFTRNNKIIFNEIFDVLNDSQDGGGLEAWGTGKGNLISNNYIHDITTGTPGAAMGIYLDDAADYFTVTNNIICNVGGESWSCTVFLKGIYNLFSNNILVGENLQNSDVFFQAHNNERNDHIIFKNNILYRTNGSVVYRIGDWTSDKFLYFDENVIYHPYGRYEIMRDMDNMPWEEWLRINEYKFEKATVYEDPMFMDLEKRNFTLKPESPALKLGFKQIDINEIGLSKEFV